MGRSLISKFQKDCKKYFSSLSARGCTYLYYNLPGHENDIVLSNADPDHLNTYSLGHLISIHHLQFKDDFLINFKRYFLSGLDLEVPYIFKTTFLTKAFKDSPIEDIVAYRDEHDHSIMFSVGNKLIMINEDGDDDLIEPSKVESHVVTQSNIDDIRSQVEAMSEPKKSMFHNKQKAGYPIHSPHVIRKILSIMDSKEQDYKNILSGEYKSTNFEGNDYLNNVIKSSSNWYRLPAYQHGYFSETEVIGQDKIQNVLIVDGLDTPSIREFLSKVKFSDTVTFKYYIYLLKGTNSVYQLAIYDSEEVHIQSTRPNNVIPLFHFSPTKNIYRHISNPHEVYYE